MNVTAPTRSWSRRVAVPALLAVLIAIGNPTGLGASGRLDPDPATLGRLRAAETPNGEVLLAGVTAQVGMANPEKVFLTVAAFDMARSVP